MIIPVIGLRENLQETMVFIDFYHDFYGGFRLKLSQQNQSIEPCMPSVSEYEPKQHGKSLGIDGLESAKDLRILSQVLKQLCQGFGRFCQGRCQGFWFLLLFGMNLRPAQ